MPDIDVFSAAGRLHDAHPFDVVCALVRHNQTLTPNLTFDEALLPEVARFLGTELRAPDDATSDAASLSPRNERTRALGRIMRRLKNNHYFGGRHTHEANFATGVPGHLLGFAADARERLLKIGILDGKSTANGYHIWLNERRSADIDAIIEGRIDDPELAAMLTR